MKEMFLAMDVSLETVEKFVLIQEDLDPVIKARGGRVIWFEAPELRVPLMSLGALESDLTFSVCEVVEKLTASLVPFKVSVEGVFAYPDATRPNLLMAKLTLGADLILSLKKVLDAHLGGLGLETQAEAAFEAMVPLGRVLTPSQRVDLSDVMVEAECLDFGESYIKNVMLIQTSLESRRASAQVYRRFTLG